MTSEGIVVVPPKDVTLTPSAAPVSDEPTETAQAESAAPPTAPAGTGRCFVKALR